MSDMIEIKDSNLLNNDNHPESLHFEFLKQIPGNAWMVNEGHQLVFASDSFFRQNRLNRADSIGKKLDEIFSEPNAKALHEFHERVMQTGRMEEIIRSHETADGKTRVYHVRIFLIYSTGGDKFVCGIAIPLVEDTKLARKLNEANERLLLLRNATSDAIWEWDMQTGSMVRNESLMKMVGYASDKPSGMAWWLRRIHPEDRNRVSDTVRVATESQSPTWQEEYRFKCADGEYKHIRDRGFVIYENGLPVKMIGCLTDTTHMRQMAVSLSKERNKQQKEISEGLVRMQENERNRIGKELQENIHKAITCANLFLEMLKPVNSDQLLNRDKASEYLRLAAEEINRISQELALPDLGNEGLIPVLRQLVSEAAVQTGIEFSIKADEEVEALSFEKKVCILRILQELVKNTVIHSLGMHASLIIKKQGTRVLLSFSDDGKGFDPRTTMLGHGLSSVYERVRIYDGRVTISAQNGRGCLVEIDVPVN